MKRYLLIVFSWLLLHATVHAASFDCAKAATSVEYLICSNGELSKLDEKLDTAYQAALQNEQPSNSIRQMQKVWLRERNHCQDIPCIRRSYNERILSLNQDNTTLTISNNKQFSCDRNVALDIPLDFYVGVAKNYGTYAQPAGTKFGLSQTAIPVVDMSTTITASPLCDGGIIAVWRPETLGKFPELLIARIYDEKFVPRTLEFRVTESDEMQWEQSVATLYDGNFVVSWKTNDHKKSQKPGGTKIRARIFNPLGEPVTPSFDISNSSGVHSGISTYGLPNGNFGVIWRQLETTVSHKVVIEGTVLRIFNKNGKALSKEILVANGSGTPYVYVAPSRRLNIFIAYVDSEKDTPFYQARSLNEDGKFLTEVIKAEDISKLEGYQISIENMFRKAASRMEYNLRQHVENDIMGFTFCDDYLNLLNAHQIKLWSKSNALINFANSICEQFRDSCPTKKYLADFLRQCLHD